MAPAEPDPLEAAFRQLEARVRQRHCKHPREVDITNMPDPTPRYLCIGCGRERSAPGEESR